MIVIADSNLVISGLYLPNGVVATILKAEKNIQFIAPDFIFNEINNHLTEIANKTGKPKKNLLLNSKKLSKEFSFFQLQKFQKFI